MLASFHAELNLLMYQEKAAYDGKRVDFRPYVYVVKLLVHEINFKRSGP